MPRIPIVFNEKFHILTERVHNKKVKSVHKIYLVYLHDVQSVSAEDHCLDQVEFSYRFL